VTAAVSFISEGDLTFALADIRSGSQDLLLRGLCSLRMLSQAPPSKLTPLIRRLVDEGLITGLVDIMRCNAMHSDIAYEVSWVFLNLAYPTEGCSVLLSFEVPRQMLDMYDFSQVSLTSNKSVENVLWLIGNIAGESGPVVARLIDSGIYAKCLEVLAMIAAHPEEASQAAVETAAWVFANILRHKPRLPFRVSSLALPHINSLLHSLNASSATQTLSDLALCCQFIFCEISEGVDYSLLHSTGLLARLLALSRTGVGIRSVVSLLGDAAAHDDSDVTRLVINDDTLDWLVVVAALPEHPDRLQKELLWLVSNIAADKSNIRDQFAQRNVFGTLLRRAAVHLRAERIPESLWGVCVEASWALHNTLSGPHSAAVPPALLQAGALEFVCAVLANPGVHRASRAEETVQRLVECVKMFLETGSTERDEAYIEHGGPPSNEYLAAFCTAGAGAVLTTALKSSERSARHVLDLFSLLIGPMVGADGPADAPGGVPVALEALLGLRPAQADEGRDTVDANDSTSAQPAAAPAADATAPAPGPESCVADNAPSPGESGTPEAPAPDSDPEGPVTRPTAEPSLGNNTSQG